MTLATSSSLRRSAAPGTEFFEGLGSDAYLFETPTDLVCPITHELFYEPVCNAAGQVYERVAIERAMAQRLVDPISNQSLDTAVLTTVYPMKSKAAAYRERAVRGCVERLCRSSCRSPIRYLRRAAELTAGMVASLDPSFSVLGLPGLTREVVEYLLTHPSSIYDCPALSHYAASLAAGGYRDLAAGVYTQLLHLGGDTQQQVEALLGLLGCWTGQVDEQEEDEKQQQLVEKLAALSCGEGPDGCRPARFVGLLLQAGLREDLVLRFCDYILGGNVPAAVSVESYSGLQDHNMLAYGTGATGLPGTCAPGSCGYSELLFVYVKLRCGRTDTSLSQRSAGAECQSREDIPGNWTEADRGPTHAPGTCDKTEQQEAGTASLREHGSGVRHQQRRQFQRALCSAVFALVNLSGSNQPLARVLKVASLLLLLHPPKCPADG